MVAFTLSFPAVVNGPFLPAGNRVATRLMATILDARLQAEGECIGDCSCLFGGEFNQSAYLLYVKNLHNGIRILKEELRRHALEGFATISFYCIHELIWRPSGPRRCGGEPFEMLQAELQKDEPLLKDFFSGLTKL